MYGVPIKLRGQRHRLISKLHDPSDAAAKRYCPGIPVCCLPVRGQCRLPGDEITLAQVVVDEILQEELVYRRPITVARH